MTMKRTALFSILGYLLFIAVFIAAFYLLNFPEKIIYDRIMHSKGYSLHREEEPVSVRFFIEPEWIDQNTKEFKEMNIELLNKHDTKLNLHYIMDRQIDMYFGFQPEFEWDESGGEFLYNSILHGDGSATSGMGVHDIALYDVDNNEIPIGQRGSGPESDFSFGIEPENWNSIKNGFYVEYSGFYLYKYVRN